MSWPDAKAWTAGLSIEGITGWRLPTADTSCSGYNCSNNEMGAFGFMTNWGVKQASQFYQVVAVFFQTSGSILEAFITSTG